MKVLPISVEETHIILPSPCEDHIRVPVNGVQKDLVITVEDRLKFQQEIASPAEIEKKDVEAFLQKVLVDTGKRNYAIAVILAYAGLRVSECVIRLA